MKRLAAIDAQTFWMSSKVPNDQFLLYVFAGEPGDLIAAVAELRSRAAVCDELRLRISDDRSTRYPLWVAIDVDPAQFVVHDPPGDWTGCLAAVAALAEHQLDPTRAAWRVHVFSAVAGTPRASGPASVVVLQIAHALADGTRAAELAGWIFGRAQSISAVPVVRAGNLVVRGVAAGRAHRRLMADVDAGRVAPSTAARPVLPTNSRPTGAIAVRTVVRDRGELSPDGTVTAVVLAAIGTALAGYLGDRGADAGRLGAEVPLANSGIRLAHNHFRNVGINLHPADARRDQLRLITGELRAARTRGSHPAMAAERDALQAMPAALLRWGVSKFDASARVSMVIGNTVVSSVNRGPADLRFGNAPVVLTAGYPALSPMMGLTHGVHGIGDTVAISVHAADSAIDVDEYIARLDTALG